MRNCIYVCSTQRQCNLHRLVLVIRKWALLNPVQGLNLSVEFIVKRCQQRMAWLSLSGCASLWNREVAWCHTGLRSDDGLAHHCWSSTQLQLPHFVLCVTSALCWHSMLPRWSPTDHSVVSLRLDYTTCSVSATELCRQLHWLPIHQQIAYKIAVIACKTRTMGTPAYPGHIPSTWLQTTNQNWCYSLLIICYCLYQERMALILSLKPSALVLLQSENLCRITVVLQNCSVLSGII